MKTVFWAFALCFSSSAFGAELVVKCDLGGSPSRKISVVRDAKIASTYIYYLQQGEIRTPFFGERERSRGSDVQVECAGKKRHALIASGEFTANALQGFAITNFPGADRPARLDFAEKSRPTWLYLAQHEMAVVIATLGYGDSDAKYVVYRRAGEQDAVEAVNQLPDRVGFEVVKLNMPRR